MLHEIFKGMDNAAEKINENFDGVSKLTKELDISDSFILSGEASDVEAVLKGGLVFFRFTIPAPKTGWSAPVRLSIHPINNFPLMISKNSLSDASKVITAHLKASGEISILASTDFQNEVFISGMFITATE